MNDKILLNSFVILLATLITVVINTNTLYGQNNLESEKKIHHEISVRPVVFFSYNILVDFAERLRFGVKTGIGSGAVYCLSKNKCDYVANRWYFTNLNIEFFSRNLFIKRKKEFNFIYDIGIKAGIELNSDYFIKRFGINTTLYYSVRKFLFGFSFQISTSCILTENDYKFPNFEIIPLILTYKF